MLASPVVVDTNCVVSRAISPTGAAAEILRRWQAGAFDLAVSEAILGEYARALGYGRVGRSHGKSAAEVHDLVAEFREFAIVVEPTQTPPIITEDPDDDKFLWCAATAGAQYIVTRDEHLLSLRVHEGIRILSPAAFLAVLDAPSGDE